MIIGLTGGIASGKSAVCEILKQQNAYIIDADEVSKAVTSEGTDCNRALKAAFPDCVVNDAPPRPLRDTPPTEGSYGALDRKLLKQKVFDSEPDRKLLNEITHPYILKEVKTLIGEKFPSVGGVAPQGDGVGRNSPTIIAVPLLFESGFDRFCDKTVCVTAPIEQRLSRIAARDKISLELAQKIIAAQIPQEVLIKRCDYNIVNDGDLQQLKKRVLDWREQIICPLRGRIMNN